MTGGTIRVDENTFEPGLFSNPELAFLLDHIEEPSVVALDGVRPEDHVLIHPARVAPFLDRLQRLDQLDKARKQRWCGYGAIKDSIIRYIAWQELTAEVLRATGGPRANNAVHFPSQYSWDSQGRAFRFGIDADNAELVRSEIQEDGTRRPFGVKLLHDGTETSLADVAPWIKRAKMETSARPDDKIEQVERKGVGTKHASLVCSICDRAEAYDPRNRNAFLAARARMGRHLKTAKDDVARHRLLYRKLYESPDARA